MNRDLNWKAAITAGLIAGAVFMMLEMALVAILNGQSPWGPPRMIAAMVLGESVLPPPATFDVGVMMAAMMIHFMMAIALGIVLGWVVSYWRMSLSTALIVGGLFGLLVYFVDFYLMTAVFPWFATGRGPVAIFSHAMFGLVLGWVYHAMTVRQDHLPEEVRA